MITIAHTPDNANPINELFAFLSLDDTGEGICASMFPGLGVVTLIASTAGNVEHMKDRAVDIARTSGKPVRLVRFVRSETLWSSDPSN